MKLQMLDTKYNVFFVKSEPLVTLFQPNILQCFVQGLLLEAEQ